MKACFLLLDSEEWGKKEATPCAPLSPDDEGMKHAHLEGWFILATTEEQTLAMKLGAWFTLN